MRSCGCGPPTARSTTRTAAPCPSASRFPVSSCPRRAIPRERGSAARLLLHVCCVYLPVLPTGHLNREFDTLPVPHRVGAPPLHGGDARQAVASTRGWRAWGDGAIGRARREGALEACTAHSRTCTDRID